MTFGNGVQPTKVQIRHFHLFCGLGGGARGFQNGHARVGNLEAEMVCVGGIDADPAAVVDFGRITGVRATYLDLFDAEQYTAWHGKPPPSSWRAAGPDEVRRAVHGGGTPDIVFLSPPCKGASGLQNPGRAKSAKYQALNQLTLRGISLMLEAFADDPVPLVILENVPRIQNAGRDLLDAIDLMLQAAGYATAHTVHDAGAIGGLAQHRKRFLLVARHRAKVPPFLYEAPKKPVRSVGEVLSQMPLPTDQHRIHKLPRLEWRTWVRLALVEAGKDWRNLQDLEIGDDGFVRGLRLVREEAQVLPDPRTPEWRSDRTGRVSAYGQYGVLPWDQPSHTVTSEAAQGSGPFSVADPRCEGFNSTYGVVRWDETAGTVTAHAMPTSGSFSVADPRVQGGWQGKGKGRVAGWDDTAGTVIAASHSSTGAFGVADPRLGEERFGNAVRVGQWDQPAHTVTSTKGGDQAIADPRLTCDASDKQHRRFCDVLRVTRWDEAAGAVTGATGNARPSVADPRRMENPVPDAWRGGKDSYESGGHYGVVDWEEASPTVVGHAKHDRGRFSVADRRVPLYNGKDKPVDPPVIVSLDGTWHRPFTTLELAALQGFDWEPLIGRGLYGDNDGDWRERIGNAVPPPAAAAIASTMAETLLLARLGQTLPVGRTPVWVQGLATVLSIDS